MLALNKHKDIMLSFFILLHHSPVINFFIDVGIGFVLGVGCVYYRQYKRRKAGAK